MKFELTILCGEIISVKLEQRESFAIRRNLNHFHELATTNNISASDSYVRKQFLILLSEFELLHREMSRLSSDLTLVKACIGDLDEDYQEEP